MVSGGKNPANETLRNRTTAFVGQLSVGSASIKLIAFDLLNYIHQFVFHSNQPDAFVARLRWSLDAHDAATTIPAMYKIVENISQNMFDLVSCAAVPVFLVDSWP